MMAAGRIGMLGIKALISPMGMSILAILIYITTGWNILLTAFDMVIKIISLFSAPVFFGGIINGMVSGTTPPLMIFYLTVILLSFFLLIANLFRGTNKQIVSGEAKFQGEGGKAKNLNSNRIKWIAFWLVGIFLVPFVMWLILWVTSLIASLFSINSAIFSTLGVTEPELRNYIQSIQLDLSNLISNLENLNVNLNNLSVPSGETIDPNSWQGALFQFLSDKGLSLNEFKFTVKNTISSAHILQSTIINFLNNFSDSTQTSNLINNGIFPALTNLNSNLQLILGDTFINVFKEFSASIENINNDWYLEINPLINNIQKDFLNSNNEFSKLSNLILNGQNVSLKNVSFKVIEIYGIEGYTTTSGKFDLRKPEMLTRALSAIIYNESNPIILPYATSFNFSGWKPFWNDPLMFILGSIAAANMFSTFVGLAFMVMSNVFHYIFLMFISPFGFAEGLLDDGGKQKIWFKTLVGKVIIIFFVSFSIGLLSIILQPMALLAKEVIIDKYDESVDFNLLRLFTMAVNCFLLIALCQGVQWSIEWGATTFNTDTKISAMGKGSIKSKKGKFGQSVNSHRQNYGKGKDSDWNRVGLGAESRAVRQATRSSRTASKQMGKFGKK